jgi:pimeloyl-ACP methyl ester carboxylesterase
MAWKRAAFAALLAALALFYPLASEAAPKGPRGSIYLMRGLANIFSLGLDTLNDQLHARGVSNSVVLNYSSWPTIAADIIKRYKTDKNALPVVVMGHSFGADATLLLSAELAKHNIPVALVIEFDVVSDIPVPNNIRHLINFYESGGNGRKLVAPPGFRGRLDNIDLSKSDASIDHLNIEKNPKLHARAIAATLAVLGR